MQTVELMIHEPVLLREKWASMKKITNSNCFIALYMLCSRRRIRRKRKQHKKIMNEDKISRLFSFFIINWLAVYFSCTCFPFYSNIKKTQSMLYVEWMRDTRKLDHHISLLPSFFFLSRSTSSLFLILNKRRWLM
jgi:hypothetical protein